MSRETKEKPNRMDPTQIFEKGSKIRLVSIDSRYKGGYVDRDKNSRQSTITMITLSENGIFTFRSYPDTITGVRAINGQNKQDDGRWEINSNEGIDPALNLFFSDGRKLSFKIGEEQKGYLFLDGKRYLIERLK